RRRALRGVAVVLDQARQLRLGDLRLRRLDRIEDGEGLETVASPRPGPYALLRLAARRGLRCAGCAREVVPELDVRLLVVRVLPDGRVGVGRLPRRLRERDDRMPVLPGVVAEPVTRELAVLP